MTDLTPSVNEIRADFITLHTRNFDEYMVGRSLTSEQEFYGAQFDAVLAAHDAQVAAKAWDEGFTAGAYWGDPNPPTHRDPKPHHANPYRIEEGTSA